MTAQVVVLMGPVRSGKTHELLRHYRAALGSVSRDSFDRAIWLAPNGRTAAAVREQLVRGGLTACLRPGVFTFDDLTRQILTASNIRLKLLEPAVQRELLRRVVGQRLHDGKLQFFADAARRSGFIELLVAHIAELKRRAIRPDVYASTVSPRASIEQQTELADLYADYESLLAAHNLLDRESAHWAARDLLAKKACPRFQELELIVADGFTDFTQAQHDTLRLLTRSAKNLLISLPADNAERGPTASAPRQDLFAKTAATFAELKRHHPHLDVRQLESRPLTCPAVDHLTQHILRHPKQIPAPSASVLDSLAHLEIVETAGAHDEIVQIARRIKTLLTGVTPARPGDILVVFRSLGEAAPRVREVFDRFGIPYSLDAGLPIRNAAVIKTLLALLRLDEDDWPFRGIVSVLTNNTLSAWDDSARRAADWLVRDLQIASGRDDLLHHVQALAEEPSPDRSEHLQRRVDAAATAQSALTQLATALDRLPAKATPIQWCEALARLGADLGLPPFTATAPLRTGRFSDQLPSEDPDVLTATDLATWHSLLAHFAALERLDAWLGQPPRALSRRELLTTLYDVATNESLSRTHDDAGRVRVVAAPSARNLSARHLFLAGMSEQAFPSPEGSGRLASDADYEKWGRVSFSTSGETQRPMPSIENETRPHLPATRAHAEMLLFYEVLSRADESLTISYPALDDKAQTLPPSPYVAELQNVLGKDAWRSVRRELPQLSPIPKAATPYSTADWRIQALSRAIDSGGDRHLLAGIFACQETKPLANAIDAGLRIVHARARGVSFGPTEGLLTSPAVAARLAQRFGPPHAWSASQWESYAACPYKFFLEDVLGLEPLGELTLEVDHRRRGSIVHNVLAAFHRKHHDASAETWAALVRDETRFAAELQTALQEVIRRSGLGRDGIDAALLELDRRQIEKWIARYREQYEKYSNAWNDLDAPMMPAHFELRFGQPRPGERSDEDPHSISEAYSLDIGGEKVLVTGRIDRLDVGRVDGKTVFNVIDYKSGRRPTLTAAKIEAGECLQPALYVMAAQALIFGDDATPLWAGYWSMQNGVTTDKKFSMHVTDDASHKIAQRIRAFVHAIRGGQFPVTSRDPDCTSRCEFNTVCRVAQARSIGKILPPDAACGLAQSSP